MRKYAGNQVTMSPSADSGYVPFVNFSGLPGSDKTTLCRKLSPALSLSLPDKGNILEGLFDTLGIGDADWRQRLSRASDEILQHLAKSSSGAVLTSFWRNPKLSPHSGTPTDWIASASQRIVEVYCLCDPQVAAARSVNRVRNPGHLDSAKRVEDLLSSFRTLAASGPLGVGKLLRLDTSDELDFNSVVSKVRPILDSVGEPAGTPM